MVTARWIDEHIGSNLVTDLQEALSLPRPIAQALVKRNITTAIEAKDFFKPKITSLHDPFLMKGMDKSVDRISDAISRKETIMIYGDYDVDGTTAVAVVYRFIEENADYGDYLHYYIPNRYQEGYGLSYKGIDTAVAKGCKLLIALDCGIKAIDKVHYANKKGIDVIICDHHLPSDVLPNAYAILNPKQKDCDYPFKELSGCGIGYKLTQALAKSWKVANHKAVNSLLDLVATSIAADIVPIIGENRILAYYGLMKANVKPSLPVKILKDTAGIRSKMNISNLVFMLSPRINAAGRMDDAAKAVAFFLERDEKESYVKAMKLQSDNKDRIDIDKSITQEAFSLLDRDEDFSLQKSIVVHQDSWHKGVVGIVASRLVQQYYKPTVVLTTSNGMITGSARSVAGFNIHDAISSCSGLLENYGGHQFAAGLTMHPHNLVGFQQSFEQYVSRHIKPESLYPKVYIDAELSMEEINHQLLDYANAFEPCGPENMMPIFTLKKVKDSGKSRVLKNKHLQLFVLQGKSQVLKGIAFNMAEWYDKIKDGALFDIAFHLQANGWNGNVSVELRVIDMRLSV